MEFRSNKVEFDSAEHETSAEVRVERSQLRDKDEILAFFSVYRLRGRVLPYMRGEARLFSGTRQASGSSNLVRPSTRRIWLRSLFVGRLVRPPETYGENEDCMPGSN
jgi:hypothetical protein